MSTALARYMGGSWLDGISRKQSAVAKAREAGDAIRQVSETAAVAAALGYVAAKKGSDISVSGHAVPVDLSLAAIGIVSGILMADYGVAQDFRNAGTTGLAIYVNRVVKDYVMSKGGVAHGEACVGAEDPIIAASRLL